MNEICPFCSEEIKKRAVEESDLSFVLLSDPRVAPGHLLVIPTRHVQTLSELKDEEVKELFKFLAVYQQKILNKLSSGVEVRQNYKPYFKDSRTHVNHLHFHIVPREENDQIAEKVDVHRKPLYQDLSEKEKERVLRLLAN